ncbi:hypothetical protein [uncultured Massilia sp.]|uniref:hypothetical protein n=1 Tax=uncultured Massilia sp. TaxID=169973 RepID=UPI0025E29C55|nr:hypothetical protein [uncultured Massilia sp.]
MIFRPLRVFQLAFLLAALAAASPASFAQDKPGFVGLPAGGTLDARKVLTARYGEQAATTRRIAGGITGVFVESRDAAEQDTVPVTFGQVFAPGDVGPRDRLVGRLADGTLLPVQVDAKARHADGSLRHAVVSAIVPKLAAHQSLMLALARTDAAAAPAAAPATPADLLAQGFAADVRVRLDGREWRAAAASLLAGRGAQAWLAGPLANEWVVTAPLVDAAGAPHPHLAARFAVRWYPQARRARVDVTVENDWAWEPGPRNFTYDAAIDVGGREVYAKPGLVHVHHARWRKVVWWGQAPAVHLRHDTPYLIASRALPNYDQSFPAAESALADMKARWTGAATEPMGLGLALAYMPTTGGRVDIGILPAWAALYLLSMDPRAAEVTLGTADLAGSWPIHFRDRRSGDPVSIVDHPYVTLMGHLSDTVDPATGKSQAFPPCAPGACDNPFTPDIAHQPNFAYLPYLLTGDQYYLEELLFWASYNVVALNPNYRDHAKGLMHGEQVRGQAWALRTLGEAAYIAPDAHPMKRQFAAIVANNLDWYNRSYTDNPAANRLHAIVNGYALSYNNGTALAPWQDDFFTSAIGHLAELGFREADRLLAWKARFPVARMMDPGACWIDGAIYALTVRRGADGPFLSGMAEAYAASHEPSFLALPCAGGEMAAALKLRPGEMNNYSGSAIGFPSNMQPALAYAADALGEPGRKAWERFMARSVLPDYSGAPQFAIVPRSVGAGQDERAAAPAQ